MSRKLAFIPFLLLIGCVFAANYGAMHNQISYTVSSDFFTSYQFGKFQIPSGYWNRTGAAWVGVLGTWWMGLVIGPPILLTALILPGWKDYIRHSLIAFAVAAGTALFIGLVTLAYASFVYSNPVNRAGAMHDAGYYLGGSIGILSSIAYLITVKSRIAKRVC